ncbi:uncharacterized protein [Neodiprion pinetum]|uniref:uncharacterized protein isoform X1 n=1 Tax=Neodiprion pinetum TaxID=441929 RepID=UPI003723F655
MKEVPRTFGNISKKFLQMITKFSASRIDVIFDQYWYPSIKDNERSLRHEAPLIDYSIYGPDQIRSSDFTKEMRNTKFKEALIEFFTIHWATDDVAPFIGNKLIHLNFKNCYSYRSNDGKVESSIVEDLCCKSHEEADSKIIFHACSIIDQSNIVIRGSDTDILIIMLGNMVNLKNPSSHIWMLTGTGNNERFIDVSKIYTELGPLLAKSLIGFHAFTGCDFNPAFYNRGKKKPFTLLKNNVEFQKAFAAFGDIGLTEDTIRELCNVIQKYTCSMYNAKKSIDVDDGRFQLFVNSYKAVDMNENFNKKVRSFDASLIPPCKSELYQQVLRTHYISSIWKNAHANEPTSLNPLEYGWMEMENRYVFKWFEGDQLPCFVSDLILNPEESDLEDEDDLSLSEDDSEDEN